METKDLLNVFTNDYGYVFEDGKLQEVKWIRTEFHHPHSDGEHDVYMAATTYQKPDGSIGDLRGTGGYTQAFDSVKGYEEGAAAETTAVSFNRKNNRLVMLDLIRGKKKTPKTEYWVFDEQCHVPARYELELDRFYYSYIDRKFHTDEFRKNCEIYDTREEALSYHSYNVVKEDGTEYQQDGINKLIMLDADQRELVRQFEEICRKMQENGVTLIGSYNSMMAFNTRNIDKYAFDYEDFPYDMENAESFEEADRYGKVFKVKSDIEIWGEDSKLFILRKPTENGTK